jgi:succinate dehydrogenase assembly factor 2
MNLSLQMNLLRSLSLGARVSRSLFAPSARLAHLEAKPEILPIWHQPQNETTEVKRRRLLYQSRKRGMLENDLLLSNFASIYLPTLNEKDLDLYDKLINTPSNDWDLYYMAIGKIETTEEYQNHVMDLLKRYVKNEKRQARIRQPDLVPV